MLKVFQMRSFWVLCLVLGILLAYAYVNPVFKPDTKVSDLGFTLEEISQKVKVQSTHTSFTSFNNIKHVEPYITSNGAGLAVVDFDKDGWPDIFFHSSSSPGKSLLFKNKQNGSFENITDSVGLAAINEFPISKSLFFDCDNDGYRDLFVMTKCPQIYKNIEGKQFKLIQNSGIACEPNSFTTAANVQDFFKSGNMDLLFQPFHEENSLTYEANQIGSKDTTHVMPDSFVDAKLGGSAPRFYKGDGRCHFTKYDLDLRHLSWAHAIGIHHIENRLILWFASDFGFDKAYLEQTNLQFKNISDRLRGGFGFFGMGVDFSYLDQDKYPYAFISEIFRPIHFPFGNALWKINGEFPKEQAEAHGVRNSGWSWGAKFVDLDNSSDEDLVVANGFITNKNATKEYDFFMSSIGSGAREFVRDGKNWPSFASRSLDGNQQDVVFLNRGNGNFTTAEVPELDKERRDGRGLALIDYNNSGSISFVVANQKQPSSFYSNTQKNKNRWIGFSLKATRTQWEAYGATAEIVLSSKILRKELQPMNGYEAQSDARLHFGLGENPVIKEILVHWPSGNTQKVIDYKLDSYNLIQEK